MLSKNLILALGFASIVSSVPLNVIMRRDGTYTVVSGDTGDEIASKDGIPFSALSTANPGVNWYDLAIGQVLTVPSVSNATATPATATAVPTTFANSTASPGTAATSTITATVSAINSTVTPGPSGWPLITSTNKVTGSLACAINNTAGGPSRDNYTQYNGDGSVSAGWPSVSDWASFDNLWTSNLAIIGNCASWSVPDNTPTETADIRAAIQAVAAASLVDARFILATMMQESGGCARVITTNWGVRNPGLMQDHNGSGTCNDNGDVQDPCPVSEIFQMIQDGVMGVEQSDGTMGNGTVQVMDEAAGLGGSGARAFYMAARIYNSGSIDPSLNLGAGGSTHCYASDIANRLMGWTTAKKECTLDTTTS